MGQEIAEQLKNVNVLASSNKFASFSSKVREVTISRPFWLSRSPITWGQFKAVTGTKEWVDGNLKEWPNRSKAIEKLGGDKTIFLGYFNRVQEFIDIMNRTYGKTLPPGHVFRLATEAEWEYALKAGIVGVQNPFVKIAVVRHNALGDSWIQRWEFLKAERLVPEIPLPAYRMAGFCPAGIPGSGQPNAWGFYDFRTVDEWLLDSTTLTMDDMSELHDLEMALPKKQVDPFLLPEAEGFGMRARHIIRYASRTDGWKGVCATMRAPASLVALGAIRLVIGPDLVKELQKHKKKGTR